MKIPALQWMMRTSLAMALASGLVTVAGCATSNSPHAPGSGQAGWKTNPQDDEAVETPVPDPNVKTLYAMTRILTVQGKEEQSEVILQRLINEYPNFVPAYSDLAELYMSIGRMDEAMELLDTGLRFSPADPVLLNNTGICHLMMGNHAAALVNFSKAVERMPREPQYRGNMAVALALQGRYEESLDAYRHIVTEAEAMENIHDIRTAQGRHGDWRLDPPSVQAPEGPAEDTPPIEPIEEREAREGASARSGASTGIDFGPTGRELALQVDKD